MFSSFSNHNFRRFFFAQSFSVIGTFAQEIAQAWLVLSLTHSATALGIVVGLQFLPMLLVAPFAGVLADRYSRQKLLMITQTAYAVLTLALWALTATGTIQVWMIYLFALSAGITGAINTPARLGFLHDLVGEKDLQNAVSLNATVYSAGRVLGPAAAGLIIAAFGVAPAFLLNGLSYIGVLAALTTLRLRELQAAPKITSATRQFRAGLTYIRHTPAIATVLAMTWVIGVFTYEFPVILPALAKLTFHGDATTLAILGSAYGIGAVAGGLAGARFKPSSPIHLAKMAALLGMAVIIAALMPNLITTAALIIVIGFFMVRFSSFANSTIQLTSIPTMRGRVIAIWAAAYVGSTAVGGPIVGYICEHVGPRYALGLGGAAALITAGVALPYLKSMRLQTPTKPTAS